MLNTKKGGQEGGLQLLRVRNLLFSAFLLCCAHVVVASNFCLEQLSSLEAKSKC